MAKCTDKERELIDSYLIGDVNSSLFESVLEEKITKELRNKLKHAVKQFNDAQANLQNMRSEFFSISSGTEMQSLVLKIESEAIDSK